MHDESSKLGLLDLEDSAEESCEECCDIALEPQDGALLLNLPLAALLLLLFRRLAAADETVGTGTGDGGGGRESVGAVAPALVTTDVEETSTGDGDEEVVEAGWAELETDEGVVSKRGILV